MTAKARDLRVDLAQAHAVALSPHPLDDEPDTAPVVEPGVERGGEESAKSIAHKGGPLLDHLGGAQ